MTRALFLENPHKTANGVFVESGIEVARNPRTLGEARLIHALQEVNYLGLRSRASVARGVLKANPQLKVIGAFCIGTSQIDLEATTELGVCVFDAPYSNTCSVTELTIGKIINLCRHVTVKNSRFHRGIWDKSTDGAHRVRGRTLGIIGYDNIGTQLSVLAKAMGLSVTFYDIAERLALGSATQIPTMESMLREADVVSVHIDDQLVNASLFGTREFAMVKPGILFISLSRGFIVDIDALHDTLVLGHLADATVDVFPEEPNKDGDPFTSPLARLDNVIFTPHIGGSTEEAQYNIGHFVTGKIANYENTGSTGMFVNLPDLQFSASEESRCRVAPIHRDTPGVLTTVNNAFARTGANVGTQVLGTAGQTGYMLADINSGLPVEAIEKVRSMKDTIRLITTRL